MDKLRYEEMVSSLNGLIQNNQIQNKEIYLFGHCNATEELVDLLLEKGFSIVAILDNNTAKQGKNYRGIVIQSPETVLKEIQENILICIVARAYAAMAAQLERLGFLGMVHKLVDYNSYAEYSLSEDTIVRKCERIQRGILLKERLENKYPGYFKVLCPFAAMGDVCFAISYLPYFLQRKRIGKCVICVIGKACAEVAALFSEYPVEVYLQKDMDELVQACLYTQDQNVFIPHQDRPYVVKLSKALHVKCIPLEIIYRCGVYGLPANTKPYCPTRLYKYSGLNNINGGNAVIFSPYAKSVTALNAEVWEEIVKDCLEKGYQCFTNVVGDERPLPGTISISPTISEIQSAVERAGIFIGIRSGLCDVLRYANCKKIALYPDYNYCDTKWKAIDMYSIDGWENIVVGEGFKWKGN